tara:strand:- start:1878 stop:2174 length:297 start_codon:yes stop_codon:yes gene_type:complete
MEIKMKLKPKNNWIEVSLAFDKAEEEYEKSLVALPEDYKPLEKPYKTVSVVSDPDMSKKGYKHGDVIVVPTHVIREVEIRDNKFYLVERNHVLAVVAV